MVQIGALIAGDGVHYRLVDTIEVITMTGKRRRRFWSIEGKCRIVAQTRVPGSSVSEVARRYDVNANLVFKWLRDPRFATGSDDKVFLPVEVSMDAPSIGPEPACPEVQGKIGISLANGRRLEIIGDFDPDNCAAKLSNYVGPPQMMR